MSITETTSKRSEFYATGNCENAAIGADYDLARTPLSNTAAARGMRVDLDSEPKAADAGSDEHVRKISRLLERMAEQLEFALSEHADALTRDGHLIDARDYWMAAFKIRQPLNRSAIDFLISLDSLLGSETSLRNDDALTELIRVSRDFAKKLSACTEKDVEFWVSWLEDADYDFGEPISREISPDLFSKATDA